MGRPRSVRPQLRRDSLGSRGTYGGDRIRVRDMSSAFISDGPPWWFFLFGAGPILLVGAAWLFLAATLVFRGDDVDKPNRMAQFYGYSVCLIAIIVVLVSATSVIDAAFERANPLQGEGGFAASLTSFESYRATYQREQRFFDRSGTAQPDTIAEPNLRQQYDALVRDRIAAVRHRTTKSMVTSTFLTLLAVVLFGVHWRWVRRLPDKAAA